MERKCFSEILSWNRKKDRTKPLKNYEHDLAFNPPHEILCTGGFLEIVDSFLKKNIPVWKEKRLRMNCVKTILLISTGIFAQSM